MGNKQSVDVLIRQDDYVMWEHGGYSGVGRVVAVERGGRNPVAYVLDTTQPLLEADIKVRPVNQCTKIDPAVAKLFENSNS